MMPQLNFFKVFAAKKDDLISLLQERSIVHQDSREVQHEDVDFLMHLYFSSTSTRREVKWIPQLRRIFNVTRRYRNNYSAVVLIEFSGCVYAICYGVSHHFVAQFSDWSFGIDVAERLFKKHSVKNTREFGGIMSRAIVTYSQAANIPFEAGEAVHYLKGEPEDKDTWGKTVSCGQSVRLSDRDFSLENAHILANNLETLITGTEPISRVPKSHKIQSTEQIAELNADLIKNMENCNYMVQISDQQLAGVEFIFSDRYTYHLQIGRQEIDLDHTTNLDGIAEVVRDSFGGDYGRLLQANVIAREDDDRVFKKKMIDYIDYIDSQNFFYLQDGKWYEFDRNYLTLLTAAIDQIDVSTDNEYPRFDEDQYQAWLKKSGNSPTTWYRERYFNDLLERENGYQNYDRTFFDADGLSVEIADAVKDTDFVHVKFGTAQKMAYLIDQSTAALNVLKRRGFSVDLEGGPQRIETLTLWMFLKRANQIDRISDMRSLIFMMKLANWQREATRAGLHPHIKLSYY